MSFLAGLLLGMLPLLWAGWVLIRGRHQPVALLGPSGTPLLANALFRELDPGTREHLLQDGHGGPTGLRMRPLPGLLGLRLVLVEAIRIDEPGRGALLETLLFRFEEGGPVHRLVQQVLADARGPLGASYLDQLLGNPAEDEVRDPFVDAESYQPGEEERLLDLLARLARDHRPDGLVWKGPNPGEPVPSGLQAFLERRGLQCLLAVPLNGGGAWRGGLLVGWGHGQYNPARHRLALELCVLLQTQLQNRRTLRQLKLLNRELREDLGHKSRRIQELDQRLKSRQRELEEASTAAAEASRLKSEFLASMSHELRTPLNAIKGYTSIVLKEEGLSPRQQLSLERVRTSSDTLLKLINDILDYSRMESGKLALELELVNASAICRETVAHLEPLAQERELQFGLQADGPDIHAVLDRSKLERILINLLGNAIKFTDRGSVGLLLFRREGMLVFEVKDTGIGIHPEERELIFQHFRQGDGTSRRQHGGTGLGLAITARLVELLGGRLELDSELGRGSTFRVYLPIFLDLDTAHQVLAPQAESRLPV
jgi:signal transduction histidine kinase